MLKENKMRTDFKEVYGYYILLAIAIVLEIFEKREILGYFNVYGKDFISIGISTKKRTFE